MSTVSARPIHSTAGLLDRRANRSEHMDYGKLQYLVKWLGYSVSDNEWILAGNLGAAKEYVTEFHQKCPSKPLPENLHREKRRRRQKNQKKA